MPRRRSGRKTPSSNEAPNRPAATIAPNVAMTSGSPRPPLLELRYHAAIAPKVISSPWAKFVRPVVPKINDSPTAASAITRPNRMPLASRLATRSTSEVAEVRVAPSGPSRKMTDRSPVGCTRGVASVLDPSSKLTPSGRESSSRVTSYWPAPGTSTATNPSASDSAVPTSSPSRLTIITTPSSGSSSSPLTRVATIRGPPSAGDGPSGAPVGALVGAVVAAGGAVVVDPDSCAPTAGTSPTTTNTRVMPHSRLRTIRAATAPHCKNNRRPALVRCSGIRRQPVTRRTVVALRWGCARVACAVVGRARLLR
eukprot:Opistho-1_new@13467